MILAFVDTATDLNKLADMADKVMEVTGPSVSAISSELKQLHAEIEQLTEVVTALSRQD